MKIIIFIILLFFSQLTFAQSLQKHKQVFEGLNNYMEFIHQTCHLEFMMQADLLNFNGDIISYKKNPQISVNFNNRDFLTDTRYYAVTPQEIYQICINSNFGISSTEKKGLDTHLQKLMQTIDSLQAICNLIEKYTTSKEYTKDSCTLGLKYLETSKILFDSYYDEWVLLVVEIKKVAAKYEVVDLDNPYIRTAKSLDSLFLIVYEVAVAVKTNDSIKVRNLQVKLENKILYLENRIDINLNGAESYGRNNGKDPWFRYENVIFDAKAELSHVKSFLKKSKYPNYKEKIYGKSFYWYNFKIINKFNRHGIGIGYEFNNYADNSNNLVLKQAQLPHTLIVSYPKKPITEAERTAEEGINTENTKFTLENSPANNLVFLLDVSGSMNQENKLPLLQKSMKFLVSLMRDYDYITIVTYSGSAQVKLKPTSAKEKKRIEKIIDNLYSGGKTNVYAGLKLAYKNANNNYLPQGNNRIILATDGDFEISKRMNTIIAKNSNKIVLSIFYFNMDLTKKTKFDELSNLGNGNCVQITEKNINKTIVNEARGGK